MAFRCAMAAAAGSGLGGLARFGAGHAFAAMGAAAAWATLFANVSGCFAMGVAAGRIGGWPGTPRQHFWMTGFCGGYTTFSAFAWATMEWLRAGEARLAGYYAAGNFGLCLVAAWAGLGAVAWARRRSAAKPPCRRRGKF